MCEYCHYILTTHTMQEALKENKACFCREFFSVVMGYKIGLAAWENKNQKDVFVILNKQSNHIHGICADFETAHKHMEFLMTENVITQQAIDEGIIILEKYQLINQK